MAFKSISASVCSRFNLNLPIIELLKAGDHKPHLDAVHQYLAERSRENVDTYYDCSWTIDPQLNQSKTTRLLLLELVPALTVWWHSQKPRISVLGLGVPKYKTDRFFQKWGYQSMSQGNSLLPAFPHASLMNEPTTLMCLNSFSKVATGLAHKHRHYWHNRLTL
jgi:hypothetical protein